MAKHKECLICSSSKLKELKRYYDKHGLVKCKSCGFIFMEAIPSKEELDRHYSKYSYTTAGYLSQLTVKSYEKLLDEFEPFRQTNKILDIGCGRGWFLEQAKKRRWEVYGTEYSEEALKICEAKGLRMKPGMLKEDTFGVGEFDVITSFEVIEHINNPKEEVGNICRFLRQGGLFYCTTPNFNAYLRFHLKEEYNVIEYPEHLSYYTKRTLGKLLRQHGFSATKLLTTGISVTRLRTSKKTSSEKLISMESGDEKLRHKFASRPYLGYIKALANYVLTITGVGISLKGYFVKR